MKKIICILLCIVMCVTMCSCSSNNMNIQMPAVRVGNKGKTAFNSYLNDVVQNNGKQSESNVYLTKEKFIYTTEDTDKNNTFGTPELLLSYDLKNGKITDLLNFKAGNIENFCCIENTFYFTCYTYTVTGNDWGFCLYSIDLTDNSIKRIYAAKTPSGVIYVAANNNFVYYAVMVSSDDASHELYDLHKISSSGDDVILKSFPCRDIISYKDSVLISMYTDNQEKDDGIYLLNDDNSISKTDLTLESITPSESKIHDKTVSGTYGRYSICYDIIKPKTVNEDECGYRYKKIYYLYDNDNDEFFKLSEGSFWFYYF